MRIPAEDAARAELYQHVIEACFASLPKRKANYAKLWSYYINGCSPEDGVATFNKIYPTLDTLTAFLYAPDSTKFSCHLGPDVAESEWDKVPTIGKAVNTEWINSNGGLVFGSGLELALVYNSSFVKVINKGGQIQPYLVDPHCVGVYREDANYLDRQEAVAHKYYITHSQLEAELAKHPARASILAALAPRPERQEQEYPDGLKRIIVTNAAGTPPIVPGGTIRGNGAFALDADMDYKPDMAVDMICMTELMIWDDSIDDYRCVTMADDRVTVYDRPNFFVKQEQQLVHICPNPLHGYFWGASEVARLLGLQQLRNRRMGQIDDLLEKQVNPPTSLEGWNGAIDELDFALNKAGGVLQGQDPMSKVQRFAPNVPTDVYSEIREIDGMFSEASGLQNLLMGKGESGVRSGRQTSELARLGSARIKKRALVIEDSLSAVATKYFKAMRKYSKTVYSTEKGLRFILDQTDESTVIKVDAHSSSPLFVEDQKQVATELFEAKAIDRDSLLEMISPVGKEVLQRRLKDIEKSEAIAAQKKAELELKIHQKH